MIGKEKPFPEDAYPLEMGQSGGETHDLHRREFFHGVVLAGGVGANYAFAGKAEGPASSISKVNADPAYRSNTGRDFTTQAIHHGESAGYQVTPISQDKAAPGYQRPGNLGNPTVASLLRKVMELEGAPSAVGAPCGMSAIAQTYQALLLPGDRVITHRCNYDWVMTLFRNHLPSWGVKVDFVDLSKPDNLVAALKDRPAKVVHWEPYVNPTMEVLDSQSLARIARDAGAITVVDNTWLSPYLFQAHRHGADVVVHSATKYIGGHGNAMGGIACGKAELVNRVGIAQNFLGGLLRPMDAFLISQGLKTLSMRMERHSQNALMLAEFLASHPAVAKVRYGALKSWNTNLHVEGKPRAFGGMLGIEWKHARHHQKIGSQLKLVLHATSLGDPVSRLVNRKEEKDRGIPPQYSRVSVGLEDPADIISDFRQAIERC